MTILGYARFYQNINEMLPSDRPDDATIEDDEALDKWYQAYTREQALKFGKKQSASAFGGDVQIPQFNSGGHG